LSGCNQPALIPKDMIETRITTPQNLKQRCRVMSEMGGALQ
jgi:hypothetical protein